MDLIKRYARIYIIWKNHQVSFLSWDDAPNNRSLEFTLPFASGINTDINSLTMYNLNAKEMGYFLQGRTIVISAGFYNEDYSSKNGGIIAKGTIKSSTPLSLDGNDRTIQVNFNSFPEFSAKLLQTKKNKTGIKNDRKSSSGKTLSSFIADYNEKKKSELSKWIKNNPNATTREMEIEKKTVSNKIKRHSAISRKRYVEHIKSKSRKSKMTSQVAYKNLHFKSGTTVLSIIKTISKKAKIPIGSIKVNYNHRFANGYTVRGRPLIAIKKLADSANTDIFITGGKLYVREETYGEKATLNLTQETGLISHPTVSDDGYYGGQKYEAQSLMRQEIHVGALIYINDGVKNYGKCVVIGGTHEYSTSSSTVTFQFVPYAAYQNAKSTRLKKDKKKIAQEKTKAVIRARKKRQKDLKNIKSIKNKRHKRHHNKK